jgi:hypothetical protein
MSVNSQILTRAAEKMTEAVKQARYAYLYCPSSYTASAYQACLAGADALDQHVTELAHAQSAEWLRKFPKIDAHNVE